MTHKGHHAGKRRRVAAVRRRAAAVRIWFTPRKLSWETEHGEIQSGAQQLGYGTESARSWVGCLRPTSSRAMASGEHG